MTSGANLPRPGSNRVKQHFCATEVRSNGEGASFGWCNDDCPKEADSRWKPDETVSVTTHFENDVDIKYTFTGEGEAQPAQPPPRAAAGG